jgi:hypothetical protein
MTDIFSPAYLYRQYNTQETAEFLGVTPITLERYRRAGTGPRYLRLQQNVVRYRLKDIIEYQELHAVSGLQA